MGELPLSLPQSANSKSLLFQNRHYHHSSRTTHRRKHRHSQHNFGLGSFFRRDAPRKRVPSMPKKSKQFLKPALQKLDVNSKDPIRLAASPKNRPPVSRTLVDVLAEEDLTLPEENSVLLRSFSDEQQPASDTASATDTSADSAVSTVSAVAAPTVSSVSANVDALAATLPSSTQSLTLRSDPALSAFRVTDDHLLW